LIPCRVDPPALQDLPAAEGRRAFFADWIQARSDSEGPGGRRAFALMVSSEVDPEGSAEAPAAPGTVAPVATANPPPTASTTAAVPPAVPHELDAVLDIGTIRVENVVGRFVELIENAGPRIRDAGQGGGRTRDCDDGRGPCQPKHSSQKQSPIHANLHR
jgi:hypothetical protein